MTFNRCEVFIRYVVEISSQCHMQRTIKNCDLRKTEESLINYSFETYLNAIY